MSEAVKVERHGAVAVLRLDDPSAMNALSPAVKAGMEANVPCMDGARVARGICRVSEGFGCSHVFGLWMQPLWPLALM